LRGEGFVAQEGGFNVDFQLCVLQIHEQHLHGLMFEFGDGGLDVDQEHQGLFVGGDRLDVLLEFAVVGHFVRQLLLEVLGLTRAGVGVVAHQFAQLLLLEFVFVPVLLYH